MAAQVNIYQHASLSNSILISVLKVLYVHAAVYVLAAAEASKPVINWPCVYFILVLYFTSQPHLPYSSANWLL